MIWLDKCDIMIIKRGKKDISEGFIMAMTYDSVVQATRKKFLNADVSSVSGTLAFLINLKLACCESNYRVKLAVNKLCEISCINGKYCISVIILIRLNVNLTVLNFI